MRWALIGASDIAATQVLPALRELGHEAVVVVGSDDERVADYAARHGIRRGTVSVEEALGSGVDAAYVSTTNERHAAGVHAAVGAGCHVLCEKPLAASLDQARAMVDAAAAAGVVMGTNHHLRNSPVIRTLRGLVADGTLGRVVGVRVAHTTLLPERLRGWRLGNEAGAGVVLDLTAVANGVILGMEAINLKGSGDNTLVLAAQDVLDLSTTSDRLTVFGDAGDTVIAHGAWVDQGLGTWYHTYTLGNAELRIDADIGVNIIA